VDGDELPRAGQCERLWLSRSRQAGIRGIII
jgi:hypothetical protein